MEFFVACLNFNLESPTLSNALMEIPIRLLSGWVTKLFVNVKISLRQKKPYVKKGLIK
jgi:hypothetical protein